MTQRSKKESVLVAAIDFGTMFSRLAYQFKSTNDSDCTKILVNQTWEGDKQLSNETVTSILFNERKEFNSFGYLAENRYMKLVLRKQNNSWYFFKQFKMMLHTKKITRDITLEERGGKKMKAMMVFGHSIRYMKDHLLEQLEKKDTLVENSRIHWVLTVPAIWSDSAKQFMREAANEAGIESRQLTIALEPEAASLYCQVLTEEQVAKGQATNDRNVAKAGQKFMVIDLGGGTADITVQRREEDGRTTELHPPSGGYFGGTRVDQEFVNLFISLVSAVIYRKLQDDDPLDYLRLMSDFERSKRTFDPSADEIMITVPLKVSRYYLDAYEEDIEDAILQSLHKDSVEWIGDKLILKAVKMKDIFSQCAVKLVEHIRNLLCQAEIKGTDIFLMVGGFSESVIMQNAIKKNFTDVKVIIPEETGLAVVKGAVLYGQSPISVSSRMMFGDTEVTVEAEELETHIKYKAYLDFL